MRLLVILAFLAMIVLGVWVQRTHRDAPVSTPVEEPAQAPHQTAAEKLGYVDVRTPGLSLKAGTRVYAISGRLVGEALTDEGVELRMSDGSILKGRPLRESNPKTYYVDPRDPNVHR